MDYRRIDESLFLKKLVLSDAQALFDQVEKNRSYLREWLPWLDYNKTPSDSEHYIVNTTNQWGIFYNQNLVGAIGLHKIDQANKNTSIGYWLDQDVNGKGIMTRATESLIDYCFHDLNLHRIEIRCAEFNMKSRAIPQRLGFTQEGLLRDVEWLYDHFVSHIVYSKIKS